MGCNQSTDATRGTDADRGVSSNILTVVNQTVDSLQQKFAGKDKRHHARIVFARPLETLFGGATTFVPPVFPKNAEEEAFLRQALPKNFVFENLDPKEMSMLVKAMEQVSIKHNEQIITQGDAGDFFYVIFKGTVNFIVNDKIVGSGTEGDSFGELSLLYTTPRAATVKATSPCTVYRVDQKVFRYILQQQTVTTVNEKTDILKQVTFLQDLDEHAIDKLAAVMSPAQFKAGDVIMRKNDTNADLFYILQQGSVKCTEVGAGTSKYEDVSLSKPGDYFGERALITGEPRAATVTATADTLCFTIDKKTFENVLGDFKTAILKSQDRAKLAAIKIIASSKLNANSLTSLAQLVQDVKFSPGSIICRANMPTNAALYLVRTGTVTIEKGGKTENIGPGGYFGDDQLEADRNAGSDFGVASPAQTKPAYTAKAGSEEVTAGVIKLKACRKIMDTRHIGDPLASTSIVGGGSIVEKDLHLKDLKKHTILGAGTFGQVWLVSRVKSNGERVAYALKVQSKYELVQDGQANAVVYEKNIMAKLHHPFLIGLVSSFQDENFVYMLLQLIQGGELYNYIHTPKSDFLSEKDAIFYAACIAEGLGFMHRRSYVYRDLKPENVLVDDTGYCVIIDFGFAKYVPTKTFTLCGTPLYLPPEVILNRGHNAGADHWSLGVLIFEMLTGDTPFYKEGMEQMDLFRAIVKGRFTPPKSVSPEANNIIKAFLTRDPAQRIGSLAGGEDDIAVHPWFKDIDFDQLQHKNIEPPKIPKVKDPLDASNFEDWSHLDDKSKQRFPKLTATQKEVFSKF